MSSGSRTLAALAASSLVLVACGDDKNPSILGTSASALTEAEFVTRADRICADVARRFGQLDDPDGEGGAKPIGLGAFIRNWVDQLRTLAAPTAVADDWDAALNLLDESADKLDDAEGGDESAQSSALFDLQARAQRHIDAMDVPFHGCFKE